MVQTAIQLYTIRELDESVPDILRRVSETGYDGVEFAYRVLEADRNQVLDVLDETGLEAAAAHISPDVLEDDLEETIETYRELGCERLVIASLGDEYFESPAAVAETAEYLSDLAADVSDYGIELGYHNHSHEFVDVADTNAWELLVEETAGSELVFELDVGWTVAGGHDPAKLLECYGDRIPLVHVTDVDQAGNAAEVGEGIVDLQSVATAAHETNVAWFIYENDEPEDPRASIGTGAEQLLRL